MPIFLPCAALLVAAIARAWATAPRAASRAPLDVLEAAVLAATGSLIVVGWLAVVLSSVGSFSLRTLGAGCAGAALVAVLATGPRRMALRSPSRFDLAALAVVLLSFAATLRPHEYVLGGADAGTYMNVASHIARHGGLVVHDDWVGLAGEHGFVSLRPSPRTLRTRRIQFVGWYVDDADASRILPQFLPFHPALLAVAMAIGGLRAGLYVPPACAALGVAAVYLLARRLFGAATGLLAAAILAATPTHLFFARYPTAEPATLLLVFAGLLAYQHLRDGERSSLGFGLLGGAAFGAALLTRIDLAPVSILLVVALALEARAGSFGRGFAAFAVALAALAVHAALHAWLLAWPYVWNVFEAPLRGLAISLADHPRRDAVAAAGALVVAIGVLAWIVRDGRSADASRTAPESRRARRARRALAALVLAASAYAYFVRPHLAEPAASTTWPSGNTYPLLDAFTWQRVGWYLTPLGIALATVGLGAMIAREPLGRIGLFASIGALTTALYVARISTTPYQIYAMRRFVPIAMPALAIFAAYGVRAIARTSRLPRAGAIARALAVVLVAWILYQARYALAGRDQAGAIDQVFGLNATLKPDAVVLVTEPESQLLADTFGPPLRYVFDHPVVPIRRGLDNARTLLDAVLDRAAAEGRPVQLISVGPIAFVARNHLELTPAGFVPIRLSMLANVYDEFPHLRSEAFYGIEVYDVARAPESRPDRAVTVDLGTYDGPYLRSGFHDKEQLPDGTTARWTGGDASLEVPLSGRAPIDVEIRARVFSDRPGGPPLVQLLVDDRPVGWFRPGTDWGVFRFTAMPRPYLGKTRLELRSPTFRPSEASDSRDQRDLGVYVDWIRVSPR